MTQDVRHMTKKAVVMLSGGLDSTLAARMMQDQGIELIGLYLSAPWGCCDKTKAMKVAGQLEIPFQVVKMSQDYINLIRKPKFGYGSAMNPCIDCRIYMFKKADELMAQTGASFLVTGEVLAQRPMSQTKIPLLKIEAESGLQGRIVRPLSAKVLPESLPEKEGMVDRAKMLGISGRSRKEQMALAQTFGILDYPNPAGGCQLTEKRFGDRVRDLFDHQEKIDLEDMELLRLGRHFRIQEETKLIVGRNEEENSTLNEYLSPGRVLFIPQFHGPWVLAVGPPQDGLNQTAVGLICRYTGAKKLPPEAKVVCRVGQPRDQAEPPLEEEISVDPHTEVPEAELERMRI